MGLTVGLSSHFHDSACCAVRDGVLVAAAEEERFTRHKHESGFPWRALKYCLSEADATLSDVDVLAYYERPFLKWSRQLWQGITAPRGQESVFLGSDPSTVERTVRDGLGYDGPIEWVDHHSSHAASAFLFSPFDKAAILTVDAVGEWDTTTYMIGSGTEITPLGSVDFPHSIGLLYSAVTSLIGFNVNDGEYKTMGLAPFGTPRFAPALRSTITFTTDGLYSLDQRLLDVWSLDRLYSPALIDLLGCPPRPTGAPLEPVHADVAASIQHVLEEVLLSMAQGLARRTGVENLCLAGGVSLNCSATKRIRDAEFFRRVFIQPAAGDSGACLGAAAVAALRMCDSAPRPAPLVSVYLGPRYSARDIQSLLSAAGLSVRRLAESELTATVADMLVNGAVVGWFQGRMEFGPRALGARSILADPRVHTSRTRLNSVVKTRETFQPFAPAVIADVAGDFFDMQQPSPFMTSTFGVKRPELLQAVTHVDGSARVQTVDAATNPRFYRLLAAFGERAGCPVLLNTSFNMRDEPIVCAPEDALTCFAVSGLDALVLEDWLVRRADLPSAFIEAVRSRRKPPPAGSGGYRTYTFV